MKEEDFFPSTNDVLIVFDDEAKTSDIKRINNIEEDTLFVTGEYAVPIGDCEITNSVNGRNFFYRAPSQSVQETKRLAQLEKSMVLKHITQFKPKPPESPFDIMKIGCPKFVRPINGQKLQLIQLQLFISAREERLELPTLGFGDRCSTN